MDKFSLEEILKDDPLRLLDDVKPKNPIITSDDRLVASFEEINEFYEKNGHEPQKSSDMHERRLYARLKGIREDTKKVEFLKKYDRYNLLEKVDEIKSIDDILDSDPLGLLSSDEEDIFTLKNVPKNSKERAEADFVAKRKRLDDFAQYEELFKECHRDLKEGKRKLVKFNEKYLQKGSFFVLKGVLGYLEDMINPKKDKNHKIDGRTKTIFENGTYSNMLFRSLAKGLYEDGYLVSEHEDRILDGLSQIDKNDRKNGYIYVLKSLSKDDRIVTKRNLYKIGFSTTPVRDRIKNAKNDPTYLMADVKVVAVFEVYNINPQKLEQLIHRFFASSCIDIDIENGKVYKPREWFIAPLSLIEKAIELIINGNIVNYQYDIKNEKIECKID